MASASEGDGPAARPKERSQKKPPLDYRVCMKELGSTILQSGGEHQMSQKRDCPTGLLEWVVSDLSVLLWMLGQIWVNSAEKVLHDLD